MGISVRGSTLGLILATACGGGTFKTGDKDTPAGGAMSAAGGDGAAGGALGGAGGEAGGPEELAQGGQGGTPAEGEGGGAGASEPVCASPCSEDEECAATPTGAECRCSGGLVRDGEACRLPQSCDELHRYAPSLPSGSYALKPEAAAASFQAYCGMMLEGGGWTLVLNEGTSFDPTTNGVADALCYSSSCTSLGYSLVPLRSDVMIDVSNDPIATTTYGARLIVTGVHAMSRGKTLRTLFTTGPNYVEAEDNSNVAVRMRDGSDCSTLPADLARIACEKCDAGSCKVPVMVFGDADALATCRAGEVPRFAIGAATDYATSWSNCAGWPQDPNHLDFDFYPDYVRVWIR